MRGGPIIKCIEEVPEEEMTRIRYNDGLIASIWERWIELSPRYIAFHNRWDPGAMSPYHGHHGDHVNLILQGEIRHGDVVVRAGDHIMLEYGDLFGPWVAGPEGCTLYGFVAGEGRAYAGDPAVWQAFLEAHGAESLPIAMPKRIPPWWREQSQKNSVTQWVKE